MPRHLAWVFVAIVTFCGATAAGPAVAAFSSATYQGKAFCPKGTVFSPRKGGECWSCDGDVRTLAPVTTAKACKRPGYNRFRAANVKKPRGKVVKLRCDEGYKLSPAAGLCYRCPKDWHRSIHSVKSNKACYQHVKEVHSRATFVSKFGCGRGQVFSLRGGGQCWSCPSGYVRTISRVNGKRACTNKFGEIFTANKGATCRKVVGAFRGGAKAVSSFTGGLGEVVGIITKPVNKVMKKLTSNVKTPRALEIQMEDIAERMRKHRPAVERIGALAQNVGRNPRAVKKIFLDPQLMCGGDRRRIDRALVKAGFGPKQPRKAGLFDGLLIGSAHAQSSKHLYTVFSLAAVGGPVANPVNALALTYVTDFRGSGGWFFSPGRAFGTGPTWDSIVPFDITFSAYAFPYSSFSEFDGVGSLGGEVAFPLGGLAKEIIGKLPERLRKSLPANCSRFACPQNFLFSFDPFPPFAVPGFGFEWSLAELELLTGPKPEGYDNRVSGSVDFSFPL